MSAIVASITQASSFRHRFFPWPGRAALAYTKTAQPVSTAGSARVPKPSFRSFSGACALSLVSVALAPAQAESYEARFDFRVSGIRAGEVVIGGEQSGGRYAAIARVNTAGLVGVFADFYFDGAASGRLAANGLVVPAEFNSRSKSTRAERVTHIDWEGGTPVSVSVEPPRGSAPDPATQAGTLDPVSASFAILRDAPVDELCNKSVDVFDGSRRSRISLGAPAAADGRLVCPGRFTRIEGEAHDLSSDQDYGFTVVFQPNGDGIAKLERIETRTDFGPAVLQRR
jgi:hypothetical protein